MKEVGDWGAADWEGAMGVGWGAEDWGEGWEL